MNCVQTRASSSTAPQQPLVTQQNQPSIIVIPKHKKAKAPFSHPQNQQDQLSTHSGNVSQNLGSNVPS